MLRVIRVLRGTREIPRPRDLLVVTGHRISPAVFWPSNNRASSSSSSNGDATHSAGDSARLTVPIPVQSQRISNRELGRRANETDGSQSHRSTTDGSQAAEGSSTTENRQRSKPSRTKRRARRRHLQRDAANPTGADRHLRQPGSRIGQQAGLARSAAHTKVAEQPEEKSAEASGALDVTDVDPRELDGGCLSSRESCSMPVADDVRPIVPIDPFAPAENDTDSSVPRETLASGRIEAGKIQIEGTSDRQPSQSMGHGAWNSSSRGQAVTGDEGCPPSSWLESGAVQVGPSSCSRSRP